LVFTLVIALGSILTPGQNSIWVTPAYADTVDVYGAEGYPGETVNLSNVASGSGDYLTLEQNAWGGYGGQGDNSHSAGQGGNASSILSTQLPNWSTGTLSTSYTVRAQGGAGGSGNAYSSANGGVGGDAQAGFYFTGSGSFAGAAIATGGAGGDTLGNGSIGGAGGQATLGPVYGESTDGGAVDVSGTANHGWGGSAGGGYIYSAASGANGASIILSNVVDGKTTGSLTISQAAAAGSGGGVNYGSGNGGQAGSAESTLSYTKNVSYLKLYTYAAGGSGGSAGYYYLNDGGDGADGQSGTAFTDATNTGGAARAEAIAGGGSGGSSVYGGTGRGGTADATARATSTTSYVEAAARATGGDGGWSMNGSQGGAGAAATSTAQATSAAPIHGGDNNWYAGSVTSDAIGGDGGHSQDGSGGAGGTATAESTFTYTYTGSESAGGSVSAGAQGGAGVQSQNSSGGAGGDATATATGYAPNDGLSVSSGAGGGVGGYSYTGNHGQGGAALATSTGTAATGLVSSDARSYAGPSGTGPTAVVVAQAGAIIANGGTSVSVSGTNEGSINKNLGDAHGRQAAAFGTVLPSQDSFITVMASNAQVQAAFAENSQVLGYGVLGRTAASSSDITYNSSLTYGYNLAAISNPRHLLVGLLDSSFSGSNTDFQLDFQIWGGKPEPLYNLTFTSPDDALRFFDDRVLDLGLLTNLPTSYGTLDLSFRYTLVAAEGASFNFNFIEGSGSPVPIPASVLLLGSGLLGLAGWRRFKKS